MTSLIAEHFFFPPPAPDRREAPSSSRPTHGACVLELSSFPPYSLGPSLLFFDRRSAWRPSFLPTKAILRLCPNDRRPLPFPCQKIFSLFVSFFPPYFFGGPISTRFVGFPPKDVTKVEITDSLFPPLLRLRIRLNADFFLPPGSA